MRNSGFLMAFTFLFALMGCSSDDSEPNDTQERDYYFHFKADGAQVDYEYQPETQINLTGSILFDSSTNTNVVSIAGIEDIFDSGTQNRLTIFLSDSADIVTGIDYTNIVGEGDRTPSSIFLMNYYDEQGNLYSAALNTGPTALYEFAKVTFTEITDDKISGTFSGTLTWYDLSNGTVQLVDSVLISEGIFSVPRY